MRRILPPGIGILLVLASFVGMLNIVSENAMALTWSTETVDSVDNVGHYLSMAVDSNNYPHISYCDWTNIDLKYARWNGSAWNVEVVDSTGDVGLHTSITIDRNDRPHISYFDWTNVDLKYARRDGSGWIRQTVDSYGPVGYFTSIALDSNDYPYISYNRWGSTRSLKFAKWTGTGWVTMTVDSVPNVGHYTSMAIDSKNNPHISYQDTDYERLKYAKYTPSGWSKEFVDSGSANGEHTSIALDSNDYAHIAYMRSSGVLKYARWNGTGWVIDNVVANAVAGSIALNESDYPRISYATSGYGYLNYATWTGTSWDIEQQIDSDSSITSLALDSAGNVHIAYRDAANGDLKYAKGIDMTPPIVTSVSPTGTDVPLSTNISVRFSKPMNKTSTESAFSMTPSMSGSFSWVGQTMTFTPSGDLSQLTPYTVVIGSSNAVDLNGIALDGNNNGVSEGPPIDDYSWQFNTTADVPPTIHVWEPGGTPGQTFTQGDQITVTWDATDNAQLPLAPINITYGDPVGGWTTVSNDEVDDGLYSWDTSGVSCPGTYWMNLSVYDSIGQTTFDTGNHSFEIACPDYPPTIQVWEPGGTPGQTFIQEDPIMITWNATDSNPLPPASINITYGDLIGWTTVSNNEVNNGVYSWDTSGVPCPGTYWMNLSVYDSIGQTTFDIGNYSFEITCPDATPPSPPILQSAILSGANQDNVEITWNASADEGQPGGTVKYEIWRAMDLAGPYSYIDEVGANGSMTYIYADAGAGHGDPNNYFYKIHSADARNNKNMTAEIAAKYVRPLQATVNLVSIPLVQVDKSLETVLQTVKFDKAWFYDSLSQDWKWSMRFKAYDGEINNLNGRMALWVNITNDCDLTVAGIVPAQTSIQLYKGWNLVGFPSFDLPYTVSDLKVEVGSQRVEGYDPSAPYHLRVLGDTEVLQTGYGYWVWVDSPATWIVTNS